LHNIKNQVKNSFTDHIEREIVEAIKKKPKKVSKILEVKNLSKSFKRHFWSGKKQVLNRLSFSIPEGKAVGFLGANGSGKTTTFKCLLDIIKKDEGELVFRGKTFSFEDRKQIGFLPERPQFYEELTAMETLSFYVGLKQALNPKLKQEMEEGLKRFGLWEVRDKKLSTFSKGMIQKIGILQALIPSADLIILDEPFSGLDPESRFTCTELLEQQIKKGSTLFLSSHIFQDVEKICDHLVILKSGSVIFEGSFLDFQPLSFSGQQKILYLLDGQKQSRVCHSYKETRATLKKLLDQSAEILSVQSVLYNLEEKYKELMKQ